MAVKVPEQARLLVLEALIQHAQAHAERQLDARYATYVQMVLQQLSARFESMAVELPDDGQGTETIRRLMTSALHARLAKPPKPSAPSHRKEITQEEGLMIQQTLHTLCPEYSLLMLPQSSVDADPDDAIRGLKEEIEGWEDAIREASEEYLVEEDIYHKVPLVQLEDRSRVKVELVDIRRRKKKGEKKEEASGGAAPGDEARKKSRLRARVQPLPFKQPPPARSRKHLTSDLAPAAATAPRPMAALEGVVIDHGSGPAPSPPASPAGATTRPHRRGAARRRLPRTRQRRRHRHHHHHHHLRHVSRAEAPSASSSAASSRWMRGLRMRTPREAERRPPKADWRRGLRKRKATATGEKMPWTRQFTVIVIGSTLVGIMFSVTTTFVALIPPLVQFFVVYTWGAALPLSFVFHWTCARARVRLRKHLALQRGRNVEGAYATRAKRSGGLFRATMRQTSAEDGGERRSIMKSRASAKALTRLTHWYPKEEIEEMRQAAAAARQRSSFAEDAEGSVAATHLQRHACVWGACRGEQSCDYAKRGLPSGQRGAQRASSPQKRGGGDGGGGGGRGRNRREEEDLRFQQARPLHSRFGGGEASAQTDREADEVARGVEGARRVSFGGDGDEKVGRQRWSVDTTLLEV